MKKKDANCRSQYVTSTAQATSFENLHRPGKQKIGIHHALTKKQSINFADEGRKPSQLTQAKKKMFPPVSTLSLEKLGSLHAKKGEVKTPQGKLARKQLLGQTHRDAPSHSSNSENMLDCSI